MDVVLPKFPYGPAVGTIVDAEGASAFRELIESGRVKELASPEGRVGGYAASLVTAVDYLHAMRMRAPMRRAWAEMFRKVDVRSEEHTSELQSRQYLGCRLLLEKKK